MRKNEIDALVLAHQGRVRPVVFLHVLRQARLEPDDHTFLKDHVEELGAADLLRWRTRCEPGFTGVVIQEIARRAARDPLTFRHELLDAPKLDIEEDEWKDLADLLRGKVPESVLAVVVERGGPRPKRAAVEASFRPRPGPVETVDFVDDDIDGDLIDIEAARKLSLEKLLAKRRSKKLSLTDQSFAELALDRARSEDEDWSSIALEIPGLLQPAVLEKARLTPRSEERANLLMWLERHDTQRATLIDIALGSMASPSRGAGEKVGLGLVSWFARQLGTRAAWEKHGKPIAHAFIQQRAHAQLGELVAIVFGDASPGRESSEPPMGLMRAAQMAFAEALVDEARESLVRRDTRRAMAALSALVCLDPPSRLSRAVHDLRSLDAPPEALDLIAVSERIVKHSDARDATLEGLVAAFHALADAAA